MFARFVEMSRERARAAQWAGQDGISIIGLIVGIQLFSILALTAMPSLSRTLAVYRLRAAAREVYSDLQSARMGAVMTNHRFRLVVVDSYTYQLHDDANNNGVIDPGETVVTRSIQQDAPGATLSGATSITFIADGSTPTAGTLTLSISSGSVTRTANVVVSSAGRVRISFSVS